jgi:hypothetical protein
LIVPVVLNWNKEDLTMETLASLREQTYPRISTVLLDNASSNQMEALSIMKGKFPEVATFGIKPPNRGFTVGCNIGIKLALEIGADYVLLLNNDVQLAPDAIAELLAALQSDPGAGAASPLIYYAYRPDRIWFGGGPMRMGSRVLAEHGEEENVTPNSPTRRADWLPGTALLVRREAVERAGPLNKIYFTYWEDVDWCFKLKSCGYHLLFVPRSVVWHKVNATIGALPENSVYYWERNRLWFTERWGTWSSRFYAWTKILWRSVAWRVKLPPDDPQATIKLEAYRDYLLRRTGKRRG